MPQKSIPNLMLTISGSIIERVTQLKFLGLNIDSNLNCKAHLSAVSTKVSRLQSHWIVAKTKICISIIYFMHDL